MFKKLKKLKIEVIATTLLILTTIIFVGLMIYANVLPLKYLLSLIVIIALIDFFLIYMSRQKQKKGKLIINIISVVFSIIFIVASFLVFKTCLLISDSNITYKTHNYSLIVLKTSKYKKIEDLKDKSVGYYDNSSEGLDKALAKVSKQVDVSVVPYKNLEELGYALLSGEIDSILIDDSYKSILENQDDNSARLLNFKSLTKTIYKFSIKVTQNSIVKDVEVTKKPFIIYISGIDTYGDISTVSCSDVNMLLVVNPTTNQILMVSIPRDYYVQLHGTTGYKDKLTHAGTYGIEMSVQTIEDLLDVDINYYVKVNFTSLVNIVDALGGVDVYSEYTFTSIEGYHYTAGYNSVSGIEALWFARERKAFIDGDRQRGKDQQALIEAIFRKATSKSVITKYNRLLNSVNGSFSTNMSYARITSLIKNQLANNASWTLTSTSLDGTDSSNYTYTYSNQLLYVMEPVEDSVNNAKDMINQVINGEKLTSSYSSEVTDVHSVEKYDPIIYDDGSSTTDTTVDTTTTTNYTISFDSDGGSSVSSQQVSEGQTATEPNSPTKDGYTFTGWYDNNGNAYDFSSKVTSDLTVTAKWQEISQDKDDSTSSNSDSK